MNTAQERNTHHDHHLPIMQETRTEADHHTIISPDATTSVNTTTVNNLKKDVKNYIPPKITAIRIEMENGIAAGSATALPTNTNKPVDETWDNQDMKSDSPIYW
ncbi:hypothetical protein ACR78F_06705 [Sphingobacterium spiritivorum]|uniref:hypothetical protein n=1 Tax=Sphingobacterium spiritivorum TaxID=258 RepID=UPI003DA55877